MLHTAQTTATALLVKKPTKSVSVESLPSVLSRDDGNEHMLRHSSSGSNSRIDYTKYKTRLCRHFLRGKPCPFRERCVFAHAEEVEKLGQMKEAAWTLASPLDFKARSYTPETESLTGEDGGNSADSTGDFRVRSPSDTAKAEVDMPPPPSYEAALVTEEGVTAPEDFLPPTYPRRYRFNPYSKQGITYEYA